MINIIATVCMIANPVNCEQITFNLTHNDHMLCVRSLPSVLKQWELLHPKWTVKSFGCVSEIHE